MHLAGAIIYTGRTKAERASMSLFQISVRAIITNDEGEVLFIHDDKTGNLPGGEVLEDEIPLEALIRELQASLKVTQASIDQRPLLLRDEGVLLATPALAAWYHVELLEDSLESIQSVENAGYLTLKDIFRLDNAQDGYYTQLAADLQFVLQSDEVDDPEAD
jgi:ADP-ribose pyrophosphatase YjhB (NUDIX family)